jgi:hypothetical protein
MKLVIICFLLISISLPAFSGEKGEYKVSNIPAELRKESNLVIRKRITEFYVLDDQRAEYYYTAAYTIFGKDEQHHGDLTIYYNSSLNTVDKIEGYIYDAEGKEIKELAGRDIKDYSDYTNDALFVDTRIKEASLHHNVFPYTVEFKYRLRYNGYINWPEWYSRYSHIGVQLSKLVLKYPYEDEPRFWCNSDIKPVIKNEERYKVYTWEAVNLPELPEDAVSGSDPKDYAHYLVTAPREFTVEGYKGNMSTWNDFGLWYNKLKAGRGELSREAAAEIRKQYDEGDDTHTRIKKLYRYMQSRTRYVNVNLGIGGWQPLKASFVHEKGYGDCKALSNYMTAILKTAGIDAYQVLIKAGNNPWDVEEFSFNRFNHVVVCVPLPGDTVWLECTSQTMPYNCIGDHNEKRMALLISDEGGKIVHTPASLPESNRQTKTSEVTFRKNGSAEVNMRVNWTGNQRNYYHNYIASAPGGKQSERVLQIMDVPDINLTNFSIEEAGFTNSISMSIKAELPKYASVSGSRLFFKPNMTEKRTSVPKDVKRISPIEFDHPFADADTIIYNIPAGYTVEAFPKELNLETSFGKYRTKCDTEEGKIIYTRYYEISDYKIAAELYPEYRNFIAEIVKADRAQVVLARK